MSELMKCNFIDYLDKLVDEGYAVKTAQNYRNIANLFMPYIPESVEAPDWDFDAIANSYFSDLSKPIEEKSKSIYKSRFTRTVRAFIAKQRGDAVSVRKKYTRGNLVKKTLNKKDDLNLSNTIEVIVPLRTGHRVVMNNIPEDMTETEADRICKIVRAYATQDVKGCDDLI